MKRFYDEAAFQYAVDLLEKDPLHAKLRLEEYLDKYPNDFYARAYYTLVLTRLCLFEEAKEEFNYISEKVKNDTFYSNKHHNNMQGFEYYMLMIKIKILAYYENYQAIYDLIRENSNIFTIKDYQYLSYYCRIKLGLLNLTTIPKDSYRFMQTYDYNKDLFRYHVNKHLAEYNQGEQKLSACVFDKDFPIDKVIDEIKKYIPSDKRIFPGYFDNTYYFKYDNCGKVENKNTNIFAVVCFHNTQNIITMYPAEGCEKLPYVDLNYLRYNELEEKEKVKRLSQIEKFNRRFNR